MIKVNMLRADLKADHVRTTMYSKCCHVETVTSYQYFVLGYTEDYDILCPECLAINPHQYPVDKFRLKKIVLTPKEQLLNDLKSLTRWIHRLIFIKE